MTPRSSVASEPLTRQSCESCRRKKMKCTAERPACSCCLRLNTSCVYLPRGSSPSNGVGRRVPVDSRRTSTSDRVQMMERHINHLYGLLGSSTSRRIENPLETPASGNEIGMSSPMPLFAESTSPAQPAYENYAFTLESPHPPTEVIEHFAEVYRAKIHSQPLPVFSLEGLTDRLRTAPQFLLWSFLSLMLTITSHDFFKNQEGHAEDLYARSSEEATTNLASCGELRTEVIQSLCLIALRHIKGSRPKNAWMAIGSASRLYAMRALVRTSSGSTTADDSESRAYWSVFILERLFLPDSPDSLPMRIPDYPQSPSLPFPLRQIVPRGGSSLAAAEIEEPPDKDVGINGYSLRIISIWGKTRLYLHRLSQGEIEKPWLAESTHTKLGIELIEFEAQHSKHHLLVNVAFPNRSAPEVTQQSEYWNPWMTTEVLWHATQAILNHPFLHLVVLRSQADIPQSCVFLQQKVDLALYHVSWLFRILQFSEKSMVLSNPILGDAIAASASVLWLFQFSKDNKVAERTRNNLKTCEKLLGTMAQMWPHISEKLITIRKLGSLADENRLQGTHQDTTIRFKPDWFWDLLVPSIPDTNDTLASSVTDGCGRDMTSKMRLKSHFIDRLSEEPGSNGHQEHILPAQFSLDPFPTCLDDLEQFHIEDLSREFLEGDFWNTVE